MRNRVEKVKKWEGIKSKRQICIQGKGISCYDSILGIKLWEPDGEIDEITYSAIGDSY